MAASSRPDNHQPDARINGWTWPTNNLQVTAWGCMGWMTIFTFLVAIPHIAHPYQIIAYVFLATIMAMHLVSHLIAITVDPSDANLRAKLRKSRKITGRPRTGHHIIENQYCFLCELNICGDAKHCSFCNKCIIGFDHHCKWLNNCIGERNYRYFIATIATAAAGATVIFSICLMEFTAYWIDADRGRMLKPYQDFWDEYDRANGTTTDNPLLPEPEFRLFYAVVPDEVWLLFTAITGVLAALTLGLTSHLLIFHFYLMCKKLSTYDYIVKERENAEKKAREKELKETEIDNSKSKNKHNKISPEDAEMATRRTTRAGVDEYAAVETSRLPGETPPPIPTPPPPVGAHGYQLSPSAVADKLHIETENDKTEASLQRRKKKKKIKKILVPLENNQHHHAARIPSPDNHLRVASNGLILTGEDSKDLEDAIRRDLEEKKAEGVLSDDTIGPSSVKDVDVGVQKKRKKRKTHVIKSDSLRINTDDKIHSATDSGCDLEHGSPLVRKNWRKPHPRNVLPPSEWKQQTSLTVPPPVGGESNRSQYSTDGDTSSLRIHSRGERLPPPNVEIERLELPHSSDSDYEGSNVRTKDQLRAYSPRAFKATSLHFHNTLPGIGTKPKQRTSSFGHQGTSHNSDSEDSIREIPINHTQYGARQKNIDKRVADPKVQRGSSLRGYGPEIGYPIQAHSMERQRHSKNPKRSSNWKSREEGKHGSNSGRSDRSVGGVVNHGASLDNSEHTAGEDSSSSEDSDSEKDSEDSEDPDVVTRQSGNKLVHTVEIYSEVTPRPPRHKDVPPLDLSVFHQDSDADPSQRSLHKHAKLSHKGAQI